MRLILLLALTFTAATAAAQPYGFITAEGASIKTNFGLSKSDTPLVLGGGYRLNKHLAVEGSTFYIDNLTSWDSAPETPTSVTSTMRTLDAKGLGAFLIWGFELDPSFSLFARGGLYLLSTEARLRTTSALLSTGVETPISESTTKENAKLPSVAIGAAYAVDKHFSVRVLFEHIGGDGPIDRITAAGLSLVLGF